MVLGFLVPRFIFSVRSRESQRSFCLSLSVGGIVSSAREAVVQGILCLREKDLQRDLQMGSAYGF